MRKNLDSNMKNKNINLIVNIAKDRIFFITICVLSFMLVIPLFFILFFLFINGIKYINWNLLTHLPLPPGEPGGGIINGILGSFTLVALASIIAIPLGVLNGMYLAEHKESKLANLVRITVDVLNGVPSIVIGIVVYAWVVTTMKSFSGLSGALALGIIMLPVIIKSTEETIKIIPVSLKEAAYALGVPHYRVMLRVVLPAGLSGILTGIMISIARVLGETAPLLFTSFGNPFINFNIARPIESIPHIIFKYATSADTSWQNIAWGASLLLIMVILALNIIAKVVISRWKVKF